MLGLVNVVRSVVVGSVGVNRVVVLHGVLWVVLGIVESYPAG